MLVSGWWSLWESLSFVPLFVPSVFWDATGLDPECPQISGFRRNLSSWERAPKMRLSVLLNSLGNFFLLYPQFPQKLEWYNLLVVWEHFYLVPDCSWDALHNSLCSGLQVFAYFSELPFSTGQNEHWLRLKYLFFMKEINSLTITIILVGKNENWLIIIVSNINNYCVFVFSFFVLTSFVLALMLIHQKRRTLPVVSGCHQLREGVVVPPLWVTEILAPSRSKAW